MALPEHVPTAGEAVDVERLLRASEPGGGWGRGVLLLPPIGLFSMLAAVVVLLLVPSGRGAWWALAALFLLGVSLATTLLLARLAKLARGERRQVEQVEELLALRHYPQANDALVALLGRPMRLPQNRLAALVGLSRLLQRQGRHDDAAAVADVVLDNPFLDPASRFAVGCGRAMSLLRSDRLSDANKAVDSLRREVGRLDEAVRRASDDDDDTPAFDSAALTLVELYRDVHTRHDAEVLESLAAKRSGLRDALGVRLGDALALAATAAQRLGEAARAATLWADATALVPAGELLRRYPEVAEAADAHAATSWPQSRVTGGAA